MGNTSTLTVWQYANLSFYKREKWDPHRPNFGPFMEANVGVLQTVWGFHFLVVNKLGLISCRIAERRFLQCPKRIKGMQKTLLHGRVFLLEKVLSRVTA